jgi:hypothetical protein
LNNNRNNRRRGRGNRSQGGNGNQLNRIDSRARGNAPQLLEKYKKLAQDAQHNGDRVQMEYYLQFADHYFRVIADNKARLEEQRGGRRNDDRDQLDEFGYDESDFDRTRRPDHSQDERPPRDARASEPRPADVLEYGQEGESFLGEANGELAMASEAGSDDEPSADSLGEPRSQSRRRQQRKPRAKSSSQDADKSPDLGEAKVETRRRRVRKPGADDRGSIDSAILPPSIRGDNAGGEQGDTLETVE